ATSFTGVRFTSTMTSPRRMPASAAGPDGSTCVTTTPFRPRSRPRFSASSAVRLCTVMPRSSAPPPSLDACSSSSFSSAMVTVNVSFFLSRMTVSLALLPTAVRATSSGRSAESLTGLPSNSTMTSPCLRPACSAGPSFTTPATRPPLDSPPPRDLAMAGRTLLNHHAEPAAGDAAFVLQLRHDLLRQVDGDGESDADVAAATAEDRRVDADDLALGVEQGTAGVAGIDGRVGLDEVVVGPLVDVPADGADDADGDRVLEAERVADGDDPLADTEGVRITQLHRGQVFGIALDLDQRDVGLRVASRDLRLELLPVGQLHQDLVGVLDDVVVGEDVAAGVDDEAGAEALRLERPTGLPEEAFEGSVELAERI